MPWVQNLCRFCGQIQDACYDVFDLNLGIAEKIWEYFNLQISKEDFKPKTVCYDCYGRITECIQFIDLCLSTSKRLELIYFQDPVLLTSDEKCLFNNLSLSVAHETFENNKQSVIVSNKQAAQENEQCGNVNKTCGIVIINDCHITKNKILEHNINSNVSSTRHIRCFLNTNFVENEAQAIRKTDHFHSQYLTPNEILPRNVIELDNFKKTSNDTVVEYIDSGLFISNVHKDQSKSKNVKSIDEVKESIDPKTLPNSKFTPSYAKKEKSYSCSYCDKTFKRRINLIAHISIHTNIKTFKCTTCPKAFAVKCHLTQHEKSHSELFRCHVCQKRFQVPSKLARHMHIHSKVKPFLCEFANCNKAFSDMHNLKQHRFCHTTVKHISCNVCEKLFKTKKTLNAHIKSHLNKNVYHCSFCGRAYCYKHNLKAHMNKHNANKSSV